MRAVRHIIFCCSLALTVLACTSSTSSEVTEQPPAVSEVWSEWDVWLQGLDGVMKIVQTGTTIDTIMVDTIERSLLAELAVDIEYKPSVRAGAFHVEKKDSMGRSMHTFIPRMKSDIRQSSYGYEADAMTYMSYHRVLSAMLGSLDQTLVLDQREGLTYLVTYQDDLTDDAITTSVKYVWISQ